MKKICVITGTRAEYGLLSPLMKAIQNDDAFCLQILATGMHLSPEFGLTYQQIENDGFEISEKVEMLLSSDTSVGIVKSTGLGMIGYADALNRLKPDWLVILGDRYEAFAVATAAFLMKIPIIHISGGDVTEGATDDALRHSISKMSYLHFATTEEYRKRVIQLGEAPERVFNVGGIGIDNIVKMTLLTHEALSESVNFDLSKPYFLVTFHPVTLESQSSESQFQALLDSFDEFPDYQVLITLPNSDADGRVIIKMIQEYARKNPERVSVHTSLGQLRYLSAIKYAAAVIGNSSSGVVEVASFKVPTVNIGDRQKGRARANTVIDCETTQEEITKAINQAISPEFQAFCQTVENIYGKGDTTEQIMEILKRFQGEINLKKSFYDLYRE
ncbi:UDP-N-acetylglucosamine 2-epimerase (non-hydrolysing)/GDP/UDP-N,N'-diacetylbacillosamine 2-epimerase (hydrolysing) [Arcicella aurantiaca]|uniref:UDP-N-acetylglucosamine 2-epimerase (Non-hydrolysing)/GDP/UDP-N,N'-diacetylbacillosamine 2-epimerase (Hydrolysing) n=1 Tax=Arcicella aurantiaca TaxID=591202 RepID=A0A316EBL9_9BACT|nr:UDP-N-acetylglucosamine 2-epimerase [Arcicella aurantiaca]PWK26173.1 UDP-N-acetylglucosamine 2-epimerase (non-hydrolysing)/GDP/UDP-N,N'-diacetylbacillosamine 2-epimerase (hydrolysing) [Arcicella aurantiaca]